MSVFVYIRSIIMANRFKVRSLLGNDENSAGVDIEITNLKVNINDFKTKIAVVLGVRADEFDLYYCGHVLHNERSLESYDVTPGAVFLAAHRPITLSAPSHETFDAAALQRVSSAIRIRNSRDFQQALEKTLENPSTVNNIVAKNLQLAQDPVAIALLQDADLLMLTLADSTARLRVFEAHPCLGEAVIELMKLVHNKIESTRNLTSTSLARRQYNLDQMDNEDDDGEEEDVEVNSNDPSTSGPPPAIAQWLAPGGLITADFFRQAIMAATGATVPSPLQLLPQAVTQAQPPVSEEQLQQLRDMGITDETLARRALEVSNGDIQAALEFIFGDDM